MEEICPTCFNDMDGCWCWLPSTEEEMKKVARETAEVLRKKYPRMVKPEPDKKYWTSEDIERMSMEEYAKYREQIHDGVREMTEEEKRTAGVIPKPAPPPPPPPKFEFKPF